MNKRSINYLSLLLMSLIAFSPLSGQAAFFSKNKRSLKSSSVTLDSEQKVVSDKTVLSKNSRREKRRVPISRKSKRKSQKIMSSTPITIRNFQEVMSDSEKNDVKYVLSSCASMSTFSIAMAQSDIKAALLRIQEVHPLLLLSEIFKDSHLVSDLIKIQSRGWIWSMFQTKLKETLSLVSERGLLSKDVISSFVKNLNLEENKFNSLLENKMWDDFLSALVDSRI